MVETRGFIVPYGEGLLRRTPLQSGGRRGRSTQAEPVGDLGLVTGRAQPGLRQQHDVDVVVLEVPTDLALKRQTRSVFSDEGELRGM